MAWLLLTKVAFFASHTIMVVTVFGNPPQGGSGASNCVEDRLSAAKGEAMMSIRPRRSVFYMPGSNARAIGKGKDIAR